jgi:hypothetical protein
MDGFSNVLKWILTKYQNVYLSFGRIRFLKEIKNFHCQISLTRHINNGILASICYVIYNVEIGKKKKKKIRNKKRRTVLVYF